MATTPVTIVHIINLGHDRGPVFICAGCVRPDERDFEPSRKCVSKPEGYRGGGTAMCYRCSAVFVEVRYLGAPVREKRAAGRSLPTNDYGMRLNWLANVRRMIRIGAGCCRECNARELKQVLLTIREEAPALPGAPAPDPTQLGLFCG